MQQTITNERTSLFIGLIFGVKSNFISISPYLIAPIYFFATLVPGNLFKTNHLCPVPKQRHAFIAKNP